MSSEEAYLEKLPEQPKQSHTAASKPPLRVQVCPWDHHGGGGDDDDDTEDGISKATTNTNSIYDDAKGAAHRGSTTTGGGGGVTTLITSDGRIDEDRLLDQHHPCYVDDYDEYTNKKGIILLIIFVVGITTLVVATAVVALWGPRREGATGFGPFAATGAGADGDADDK